MDAFGCTTFLLEGRGDVIGAVIAHPGRTPECAQECFMIIKSWYLEVFAASQDFSWSRWQSSSNWAMSRDPHNAYSEDDHYPLSPICYLRHSELESTFWDDQPHSWFLEEALGYIEHCTQVWVSLARITAFRCLKARVLEHLRSSRVCLISRVMCLLDFCSASRPIICYISSTNS